MSQFAVPEDFKERRHGEAKAMRELNLDRPLGFMTPAERVGLFNRSVQPLYDQIVKLYANQVQPRIVVDKHGLFINSPIKLEGTAAEVEAQLKEMILSLRAQILGGVAP